MLALALAKALKPTRIKVRFLTTVIYPINKIAIDAKLGPHSIHVREYVALQQGDQGDNIQSPIPRIFPRMELPPLQSIVPNLFSELQLPRPNLSFYTK